MPAAIASVTASPQPSCSAGWASSAAARYSVSMASVWPISRTAPPSPRARIARSSSARSGPMPKIFSVQSGNSPASRAQASIRSPWRLTGASRPIESTVRLRGWRRMRACEIGRTAFGRIATRALSGSGNQSRNSGRSTVIASKFCSAAMRRARSSGLGSQRSGLARSCAGTLCSDATRRSGAAGRTSPSAVIAGGRKAMATSGRCSARWRSSRRQKAPCLLDHISRSTGGGKRSTRACRVSRKRVERAAQPPARRLRPAQVAEAHPEGEGIERGPAARLVGQDLDEVPARGQRVGGLDQHPLGAAAALGELVDDEGDPPRRPGRLSHRRPRRRAGPAARARRCRRARARSARRPARPRRAPRPRAAGRTPLGRARGRA